MRMHNAVANMIDTLGAALPETRTAYAERYKRILAPLLSRYATKHSEPARLLGAEYRKLGARLGLGGTGFCANPACVKSTKTDTLSACARCRTILVCSKPCLRTCVRLSRGLS